MAGDWLIAVRVSIHIFMMPLQYGGSGASGRQKRGGPPKRADSCTAAMYHQLVQRQQQLLYESLSAILLDSSDGDDNGEVAMTALGQQVSALLPEVKGHKGSGDEEDDHSNDAQQQHGTHQYGEAVRAAFLRRLFKRPRHLPPRHDGNSQSAQLTDDMQQHMLDVWGILTADD